MTVRLSTGFRNALCASAPIVPLMYGGTILVFDGTMPTSPDNPPAANLLAQITTDGLTFTPNNVPTPSGLVVALASYGYVLMNGNWVLVGTGLLGTATWFLYLLTLLRCRRKVKCSSCMSQCLSREHNDR